MNISLFFTILFCSSTAFAYLEDVINRGHTKQVGLYNRFQLLEPEGADSYDPSTEDNQIVVVKKKHKNLSQKRRRQQERREERERSAAKLLEITKESHRDSSDGEDTVIDLKGEEDNVQLNVESIQPTPTQQNTETDTATNSVCDEAAQKQSKRKSTRSKRRRTRLQNNRPQEKEQISLENNSLSQSIDYVQDQQQSVNVAVRKAKRNKKKREQRQQKKDQLPNTIIGWLEDEPQHSLLRPALIQMLTSTAFHRYGSSSPSNSPSDDNTDTYSFPDDEASIPKSLSGDEAGQSDSTSDDEIDMLHSLLADDTDESSSLFDNEAGISQSLSDEVHRPPLDDKSSLSDSSQAKTDRDVHLDGEITVSDGIRIDKLEHDIGSGDQLPSPDDFSVNKPYSEHPDDEASIPKSLSGDEAGQSYSTSDDEIDILHSLLADDTDESYSRFDSEAGISQSLSDEIHKPPLDDDSCLSDSSQAKPDRDVHFDGKITVSDGIRIDKLEHDNGSGDQLPSSDDFSVNKPYSEHSLPLFVEGLQQNDSQGAGVMHQQPKRQPRKRKAAELALEDKRVTGKRWKFHEDTPIQNAVHPSSQEVAQESRQAQPLSVIESKSELVVEMQPEDVPIASEPQQLKFVPLWSQGWFKWIAALIPALVILSLLLFYTRRHLIRQRRLSLLDSNLVFTNQPKSDSINMESDSEDNLFSTSTNMLRRGGIRINY